MKASTCDVICNGNALSRSDKGSNDKSSCIHAASSVAPIITHLLHQLDREGPQLLDNGEVRSPRGGARLHHLAWLGFDFLLACLLSVDEV